MVYLAGTEAGDREHDRASVQHPEGRHLGPARPGAAAPLPRPRRRRQTTGGTLLHTRQLIAELNQICIILIMFYILYPAL